GGSSELAYEFLRQHQPFIYPKSASSDLLDEIASIKRRIERDIVGADKLERDVKLGRGGIREIEFIVQTLQLIHGARHPFLQEPPRVRPDRPRQTISKFSAIRNARRRRFLLSYRALPVSISRRAHARSFASCVQTCSDGSQRLQTRMRH